VVADNYVRDVLAGKSAEKKSTSIDKIINAQPLSGQVQAGNVFLLRKANEYGGYGAAPWWTEFLDEAAEFPKGLNDDMVDTAAQAYNDLVIRARARRKNRSRIISPQQQR
jgi:predicted phage terminase large subunit-like protein